MTTDYTKIRRPAVKDPIKAVFSWWVTLPVALRPRKLARAYPHIVNNLAMHWDDATACEAYISSLIFSIDRPLRQGFPPEISEEILALHNFQAGRKTASRRRAEKKVEVSA